MLMAFSFRDKLLKRFFCHNIKRDVTVEECLDNYVNANAINIKNLPCYRCEQGQKIREEFAQDQ